MYRGIVWGVLLCFALVARGADVNPLCQRVAAATNQALPGTPSNTLQALADPKFLENVTTIVTSMENQVAGTPTAGVKPVVLKHDPMHTRTDHNYLVANYNHAV